METNKYKDINKYTYMSSDRLFNILKVDLKSLKLYSNNNSYLTNVEFEDIIHEIDMIQHIIKLRLYKL